MNALIFIFILSYVLYSINFDLRFFLIFFSLTFIYSIIQRYFLKTPFVGMRDSMLISSWGTPNDPHIYGKVTLDITKIEKYLDQLSNKLGKKITLTLFSIKLLSIVISKFSDINTYIKYGKLNVKKTVDLCCLVAIENGKDLANSVIRDCSSKSIKEISDVLDDEVNKLRNKKMDDHNKKNNVALILPNFILAVMVQATSWISSIGVGFSPFGVNFLI